MSRDIELIDHSFSWEEGIAKPRISGEELRKSRARCDSLRSLEKMACNLVADFFILHDEAF